MDCRYRGKGRFTNFKMNAETRADIADNAALAVITVRN